ncbi:MAG: pyridoxamine 5'-phosphate oxidase family protein, partial [Acidimicrobiia bacterium]
MTTDPFSRLRIEYETTGLEPEDLPADPIDAFGEWLDAAAEAGVAEPNVMHRATVDADGAPSVRAVLIKDLDAGVV